MIRLLTSHSKHSNISLFRSLHPREIISEYRTTVSFSFQISSNGPYEPIPVAASGRDRKKTENQYINKETENQCGVRNEAVNQPAMKSTSSKSLHSSRSCASINQPLATKQSVSSTTNEKSKKLTRSQTFRENPTSSTCSIAKRNVSLRQKILS